MLRCSKSEEKMSIVDPFAMRIQVSNALDKKIEWEVPIDPKESGLSALLLFCIITILFFSFTGSSVNWGLSIFVCVKSKTFHLLNEASGQITSFGFSLKWYIAIL